MGVEHDLTKKKSYGLDLVGSLALISGDMRVLCREARGEMMTMVPIFLNPYHHLTLIFINALRYRINKECRLHVCN